jgi:SAM-dependent methyltransferase
MGFDANGVRFVLDAVRSGVVLDTCAILGRQEMHLTAPVLKRQFEKVSMSLMDGEAEQILENNGAKGYCESFLSRCGANRIVSFDNSNYEAATVVHDMNEPIASEYENRFDCVIDSGTLEHIFDFPTAIRNCMKMVKPGGHFLSIAPCNNFMGHGFYQFSPELFYGVLSERNGYVVERMLIFESRDSAQWYLVADPARIGGRVELSNSVMTYLLVQARRVKVTDLADITPQQSDYTVLWNRNGQGIEGKPGRISRLTIMKGLLKEKGRKALSVLPVERLRTPFHHPWYAPYE